MEERDECLEATRNLLQSYPVVQIHGSELLYNQNNEENNGEYLLSMECLYEEQVVSEGDVTTSTTDGDLTSVTCSLYEEQVVVPSPPQSEGDVATETDLTSLNWLHNITNIMAVPNLPTPPVSPKPPKKKPQQSGGQQEDLTININYYKKNGDKKPPFSYATLICMAMGKNGNKMTLSAIYHWIRENFLYYRKAHPSWQVSTNKHRPAMFFPET